MTIIASDTFQRSNQSGWGTASDGETWAFTGQAATESIASNEGVIAGTSVNDTHAQIGTQTLGDQELLCRIAINNSNDICGLEARFSTYNNTYKFLYYSNAVHINKTVSGSNSNLANSGAFTMTVGTFYWFRFRCQGTTIEGKVWQDGTNEPGSWTVSTTDSSLASGGFALLGNTGTGSGVQYDHFTADNLVTQPSMVPTTVTQVTFRDGETKTTFRDGETKVTFRDGQVRVGGR